ncbi:hypothetical protein GS942_21535 [Rhodococcus hoagii]|nr:hypothetical protein [Prescottella equi]
MKFFEDKPVNVVLTTVARPGTTPTGTGPTPSSAINKWETFLAGELPPLIDDRFGGNGIRRRGLSMGAQSAMMLAMRSPACTAASPPTAAATNPPHPSRQAQMASTVTIERAASRTVGPFDDPKWAEHDVLLGAEKLRGTTLYVSTGTVCPGRTRPSTTPTSSRTWCARTGGGPPATTAPGDSTTGFVHSASRPWFVYTRWACTRGRTGATSSPSRGRRSLPPRTSDAPADERRPLRDLRGGRLSKLGVETSSASFSELVSSEPEAAPPRRCPS